MGGGLLITKEETAFFVVSFLSLFAAKSTTLCLFAAIALFTLFLHKRKELYFLYSILAPRITGDAPIPRYLLELAREEGPGNQELPDVFQISIPFLPPLVFVFKREYIKRILSLEPDQFPSGGDKGPMVKITGQSGKNILLSSGPPSPHWIKYREITSVINKDRFGDKSLIGTMFDQTWKTTQELSESHFADKLGLPLDLFFELYHIMIPAHNRALFGEECAKKFTYTDLSKEMYDIITETGKQLKYDFCPPNIRAAYQGKLKRVQDAVNNMMNGSSSKFMKPLLDARKSGAWTEEELLSNIMVFEYAQAPLHVAFWLLYALSLHPEEEKKVVAEISSILSEGPLTYDRLSEFKYLSKVVSETLRLYPGVGLMQVRFAKSHCQFGSSFVQEGSYIFLCNYLIQRNATYWPNPDDFIPNREGIDPALYGENLAYIPFGNGPRQCQGQYFATNFVKSTVIAILQKYKLSLSPGQQEAIPTEIGFLRPCKPVYFTFEKRVLPPTSASIPKELKPTSVPQTLAAAPTAVTTSSNSLSCELTSTSSTTMSTSSSSLSRPPKRVAPKLSKASGSYTLISQSQIFKDSFQSIGKLKNTKDMLVLYGSQTGTARGLATRLVHMAGLCKLSTTLAVLSEIDVKAIKEYKVVIVVTSTYGDGGAPENAEKFENWLENETSTDFFSGMPYAVLALGSSMYPFPFKFGTYLSRRFSQMGAVQLIPDERLDEIKYNTQEAFTAWSVRLFDAISFDFNVSQATFKIAFTDDYLEKEARREYPGHIVNTRVASNTRINSDPTNEIFSLEVTYEPDSLSFQAGDNAIIIPSNPAKIVERLINRLGYEKDKVFCVENLGMSIIELSSSAGPNTCTLEIALSYYYDITSPPSTSMLQFIAMHSTSVEDQNTVLSYVSNYLSFLRLNYSVVDLLESIPSITIPQKTDTLAIFLDLLGPIKHRHYSIANFPGSTSSILRIVYKVVNYTTKSGQQKSGLCSNYLKAMKPGEEVKVAIVKSKFRLPSDSSTPLIMVGAGSGISPYFGFLEQRSHSKNNGEQLGEAILIHGCRTEADFANKAATDEALRDGLLTQVLPAYSRMEGVPRTYIQDVVEQQGERIWNLLNEGATVYVCGDVSVGMSVRDVLAKIAQIHGNYGAIKANSWVLELIKQGRLRNDEWGVATSSGTHAIRAARLRLWRKSIMATLAFARKQTRK